MNVGVSVRSILLTALFLFLTSNLSFALYPKDETAKTGQSHPNRIIVKINPEKTIHLSVDKSSIAKIGIADFDAVNTRYTVEKQEILFKRPEHQTSNSLKNIMVIEVPEGADMESMLSEYRNLPEVVYAQPDWEAELYDSPNDPLYPHQWALNNTGQGYYHVERIDGSGNDTLAIVYGTPDADIDADEVYNNPPDNTSTVVVAILDTGVDMTHPDLAGKIWNNPLEIPDNGIDDDHNGYIDDYHGWDFCSATFPLPITGDNDPTDTHGHGTHCSGIVTAVTGNSTGVAGIAPNCKIMPIKFAPVMLSSFAAAGVVYAADNGADVISMSFGYPWQVQVLQDALDYAREKGVVPIASAGNDGIEKKNYPAACEGVITVGATNSLDEVTYFSTFGDHVNICAPGRSILSLRAAGTDMYGPSEADVHIIDDQYYLASGTSMSGPMVAGAAAYIRSVSMGLTPAKVREILENSADDIIDPYNTGDNYPGYDIYSGYGRLNLLTALNSTPIKNAIITSPLRHEAISGMVTIYGTANGTSFSNYILEYGEGLQPNTWHQIHTSSSPVTDGTLGTWNTSGLDGVYSLRLKVGQYNIYMIPVYVTNGVVATIDSPLPDETVSSIVNVIGSASCADFAYYELEYGTGSSPSSWTLIEHDTEPKTGDTLARWHVDDLSNDIYTLRLSVYDGSDLAGSSSVQINIQSPFTAPNGWKIPFTNYVTIFPTYGDFDNDGQNEIVVGTETGLKFYNPDGTQKTSGIPSTPTADFTFPVAVGDLNGDGIEDLVAVGGDKLYAFPSNESPFQITLPVDPLTVRYFVSGGEITYPFVSLKDIDSDGHDEITYFPGWDVHHPVASYYTYSSVGALMYQTSMVIPGFFAYLSADLDNDGTDEIYTADHAVYKLNRQNDTLISFELQMDEIKTVNAKSISAVDINLDGRLEILVLAYYGCKVQNDPGQYKMYAFDENLNLLAGWPHNLITSCDAILSNYPVVFDADGFGGMEYFFTMTGLAFGSITGFQLDGTPFYGSGSDAVMTTDIDPSVFNSLIIADFDGDHLPDLMTCSEPDGFRSVDYERLLAWNYNGQLIDGFPIVTTSQIEELTSLSYTPTVGDIDKDGHIDLAMTTANNELVFMNFDDIDYDEAAAFYPHWRFNRRLNLNALPFICQDSDGDGYGDPDHAENTCPDDNCPDIYNPGQEDNDRNGIGNACCCIGMTGNTNCSEEEEPDVSDITRIIDMLYLTHEPLCCPAEADCNGDGAPDPDISDIVALIDYLYIAHEPIADCR